MHVHACAPVGDSQCACCVSVRSGVFLPCAHSVLDLHSADACGSGVGSWGAGFVYRAQRARVPYIACSACACATCFLYVICAGTECVQREWCVGWGQRDWPAPVSPMN